MNNEVELLLKSLRNHTPSAYAISQIELTRDLATTLGASFAQIPAGRERRIAITKLEETVMWAVKAIILDDVAA